MKRTKFDQSKLRLNIETVRLLTSDNLERVNGGKCTSQGTSTFNDGYCTIRCDTKIYCNADTDQQGACRLTAYC